jgi:protoheme IX farnesyltransferase
LNTAIARAAAAADAPPAWRVVAGVFKPRIALEIMLSALAGLALAEAGGLPLPQLLAFALAVFAAAGAAGAVNQFAERDLDAAMGRTRNRPFVTGALAAGWHWPLAIALLLAAATALCAFATNGFAALFVLLGALTYGVVYTLWLKRRTCLNIVIGGLAGSFAVLAGAFAVNPAPGPAALLFALVMFLWTPPHFWSLAMYYREDYAAAGVPMLPVVHGDRVASRAILAHTLVLVPLSLVPLAYGCGWIYGVGAVAGGAFFVQRSVVLAREPTTRNAIRNFLASLLQLGLLLLGAIADGALRGHVLAN